MIKLPFAGAFLGLSLYYAWMRAGDFWRTPTVQASKGGLRITCLADAPFLLSALITSDGTSAVVQPPRTGLQGSVLLTAAELARLPWRDRAGRPVPMPPLTHVRALFLPTGS